MRVWGVDPKILCRKHLLGEHVEMHMISSSVRLGKQLGKLLNGFVDLRLVTARHELLSAEMLSRGYKHVSPIIAFEIPTISGHIDLSENALELQRRCENCKLNFITKGQ